MSSFNFSKTLRTLGLAAALIGGAVSPSLADGEYVPGATAVGSWTQTDSRTALAGGHVTQGQNQTQLEQSGATGGGGQHS
jgi:hypothetical protein